MATRALMLDEDWPLAAGHPNLADAVLELAAGWFFVTWEGSPGKTPLLAMSGEEG